MWLLVSLADMIPVFYSPRASRISYCWSINLQDITGQSVLCVNDNSLTHCIWRYLTTIYSQMWFHGLHDRRKIQVVSRPHGSIHPIISFTAPDLSCIVIVYLFSVLFGLRSHCSRVTLQFFYPADFLDPISYTW